VRVVSDVRPCESGQIYMMKDDGISGTCSGGRCLVQAAKLIASTQTSRSSVYLDTHHNIFRLPRLDIRSNTLFTDNAR
jgi:hypothetical protein